MEEGREEGPVRRVTRGAKKERQKQRMREQSEGLSIFVDAIKDIEIDRGLSILPTTNSNPNSEEDTMDSVEEYAARRRAAGLCVRDYPPKSELLASIGSQHLSVRLMFRGKVVSRARFHELVSFQQVMITGRKPRTHTLRLGGMESIKKTSTGHRRKLPSFLDKGIGAPNVQRKPRARTRCRSCL